MTESERLITLLKRAEESNGHDRRLGNLNKLNDLQQRLRHWMTILQKRGQGPSGMELAVILDDLHDTALKDRRRRARRSTSYDRETTP